MCFSPRLFLLQCHYPTIVQAQRFEKLGYEVYATRSTADVLRQNGVDAIKVNKIHQEAPTVMDLLLEHKIDIVIDTPTQGRDKNRDGFLIRRTTPAPRNAL